MATHTASVPVDAETVGLDRTEINASGQVELVSLPSGYENHKSTANPDVAKTSSAETQGENSSVSKRHRLLHKTKAILHVSHKNELDPSAPVLADAKDTVSDSRLVNDAPESKQHSAKDFIHHPASTVMSKASGQGGHQIAANLVAKEISHGNEVEVVRANEELKKPGTSSEKQERKYALDELIKMRQDMFVRWTMDRHVSKVRKLQTGTVPKRSKNDFKVLGRDGKQRIDWEAYIRHSVQYLAEKYGSRYIGYYSDPPAASKETLMPAVEKILVASAPLQAFVMSIRRVYRWENRNETLKYLAIYSVLWIFNLVLPGILAAIIFFILHRRLHPPTIEDMREDIKRVESYSETALTLSEFIEKRGDQNWVDPLIEEVGPWLMLQLADLANTMETLRNFYEWRVPSETAKTLAIVTAGLLVVTFLPITLLLRLSSLGSGVAFFGLFPISSNFPEYRLLVSPLKWVVWNIPAHGEWSITMLQAEGQRHRNQVANSQLPTSPEPKITNSDSTFYRGTPITTADVAAALQETEIEEKVYGSYECSHDDRRGRLILNALGLYFKSSIGHKQNFQLPYEHIDKLEKVTSVVSQKLSQNSGEDLKITGPAGVEYYFKSVKDRDQVFSQILGFAPVRWQVIW